MLLDVLVIVILTAIVAMFLVTVYRLLAILMTADMVITNFNIVTTVINDTSTQGVSHATICDHV